MSERKEPYITKEIPYEKKVELLFISKRLKDIVKDIDKLNDEEKEFVVNRAENEAAIEIVELYNLLGEYMSWPV